MHGNLKGWHQETVMNMKNAVFVLFEKQIQRGNASTEYRITNTTINKILI